VKDQDSRHWYYINGQGTYDSILARSDPADTYFSIGKKIEQFKFERGYSQDINYWMAEKLRRLRKKYSYLRLWFSGGKDSLLVLNQIIKNKIFVDEIVYVVNGQSFDNDLYPQYNINVEVLALAETHLKTVKNLLPNTKITKLTYTEDHYRAKFCDKNWIRKSCLYPYLMHRPELSFWQNVNPEFKVLENINDRCDIVGGAVPHVWYNKEIEKWQFCYINTQMFNSMHDHGEDFFASDECPELLNALIENMIDCYEQKNYYPSQFEIKDARSRREFTTIFEFTPVNVEKEMSKRTQHDEIFHVTDHACWAFQDYKSFHTLINSIKLDKWPKSVKSYLEDTDWQLIERVHKNTGIMTKVFTLN